MKRNTVSPPNVWVPNPQIQPTTNQKYSREKKIPESSKKQNLNLPHVGNYLHSVYTVFTTMLYLQHSIYVVVGIISNLEMIKVYGKMCIGFMQILSHFM